MSDEPEHRNWLELPRDVTASILSRLGAIDILENAQKVCSLWREICKDSSMWRSIDMRNKGFSLSMDFELEKMCMHAIDRSKGELVDITIQYFCRNELLSYISQRRLRIIYSYHIVDEGLSEAALKLSLLEELEISECKNITAKGLAVVGHCCSNLKTFKFNEKGYERPRWKTDKEARAIAENMHGLQHLQLFGNKLTNDGLLAILDGCPHLQSLDLRQCFNISLQGDLEKRCAQQIKHLRRPLDSTEDYEYDATLLKYPYLSESDSDYGYDYDSEGAFSDDPLVYGEENYFEFM